MSRPRCAHASEISARRQGMEFNLMLDRYAAERFLYRVSASKEVDRFTLKGAALLPGLVRRGNCVRPATSTSMPSDATHHDAVRASLADVCGVPCPEDGVVLRLKDAPDRRHPTRPGVRRPPSANPRQTRSSPGFRFRWTSDSETPFRPNGVEQDYPTLLDLPVPRIWTYPPRDADCREIRGDGEPGRKEHPG